MDEVEILKYISYVAVSFAFLFGFSFVQRRKNQQKVVGHYLVEIIATNGSSEEKLYPYENGEIFIHEENKIKIGKKDKNDHHERGLPRYYVDDASTINVFYPHKTGLRKILESVNVSKVIYFEGCPEPISRRRKWSIVNKKSIKRDTNGRILSYEIVPDIQYNDESNICVWDEKHVIATPTTLGILRDERFAQFTSYYNEEIDQLKQKLLKALTTRISPILVYVAIAIGIIATGISIYLIYQMSDKIEIIKQGLGIG